jgi:hypothetical protein
MLQNKARAGTSLSSPEQTFWHLIVPAPPAFIEQQKSIRMGVGKMAPHEPEPIVGLA